MGRTTLIARLLVWALAIVAIDGVVIVTKDDSPKPAPRADQAASSSTTATPPTTSAAGDATTSTVAGSESATSTPTTTETAITDPTTSTGSGEVLVAELSGDGDTSSSVGIHVEGRWQLRWRVDPQGNGVAATIDDDDAGKSFGYVGMRPGQSSFEFPTGCNCTLHLTPDGSAYDVVVVDVDG